MNEKMAYVYTLRDPRTDKVHYVGCTTQRLSKRLAIHVYDSVRGGRRCRRAAWIRSLLKQGLRPIIKLEVKVPLNEAREAEATHITWFKEQGVNLTNMGQGCRTPKGKDSPLSRWWDSPEGKRFRKVWGRPW